MIKNLWWPLGLSHELSAKPRRVTALLQEFVLYRTSDGKAHVLSDLCVHRGGALSDGWVDGKDCIVCPYHGWEYEQDGACIKIPANQPGVPVPKKARVDAYPTVEKYGWVWAYLGDLPEAERPPLPEIPALANLSAYRAVSGELRQPLCYDLPLEATLDLARVYGSQKGASASQKSYTDGSESAWSAQASAVIEQTLVGGFLRSASTHTLNASAALLMPCMTVLELTTPQGKLILAAAHLPVNDQTTHTIWIAYRDYALNSGGDKSTQAWVEAAINASGYVNTSPNSLQSAYRRMRQQALQNGWSIDAHRIRSEFSRHQAVVIPSPARREVPELAHAWVMKEMPTLPTSQESAS